jgi:hypothetical protein
VKLPRIACPNCPDGSLGLGETECPNCGERLTLQSVWKHSFGRLLDRDGQTLAPKGPPGADTDSRSTKNRLKRHTPRAGKKAVKSSAEPTGPWWLRGLRFLADLAQGRHRRALQWVCQLTYLLASAILLQQLLAGFESRGLQDVLAPAAVSVVFLAALGMLVLWAVPPQLVQTVSHKASGLVKLSLVLNFFSLLLLLQVLVRAWWTRSLILVGLLAMGGVGLWVLRLVFWPAAQHAKKLFQDGPSKDFDASNPQGRQATLD